MKILIGDKGNVDFDGPIQMTPEQKKKFIDFMKNLFAVVIEEESDKIRIGRLGDKFFARKWTPEERGLLLEIRDIEKVSKELGRSWMSVDIKRGQFIPEFMRWVDSNGYDIVKDDTKKLIEEFMEEKEREKEKKRKQRQVKRNNLRMLNQELKNLKEKHRAIEVLIRSGMKAPNDKGLFEIERKIKEIKKKIEEKKTKL